jgi:hypothetical protein
MQQLRTACCWRAATREPLWRELEDERTTGTGAHFPELRFGRVLTGATWRWLT